MSRCLFLAVFVLGIGVSAPVIAQSSDAHLGTWKRNDAKSKYGEAPATPRPRSVIRTYEVFERDGIKMTTVTIAADGKRTTGGYSAHFDGKDYPSGRADFDTISTKRVDAYTYENTLKKAGKLYETVTNVVSKDGKTMTSTTQGKDASGKAYTNVVIWDKQ
jgi:hypothetical protein